MMRSTLDHERAHTSQRNADSGAECEAFGLAEQHEGCHGHKPRGGGHASVCQNIQAPKENNPHLVLEPVEGLLCLCVGGVALGGVCFRVAVIIKRFDASRKARCRGWIGS